MSWELDEFKQLGVGKFSDALNFYDFGTDYAWPQPVKSQDVFETEHAMEEFIAPQLGVKTVYCDNPRSVAKACRRLGLSRRKAPPGDSQSNGVIWAPNRRSRPELALT